MKSLVRKAALVCLVILAASCGAIDALPAPDAQMRSSVLTPAFEPSLVCTLTVHVDRLDACLRTRRCVSQLGDELWRHECQCRRDGTNCVCSYVLSRHDAQGREVVHKQRTYRLEQHHAQCVDGYLSLPAPYRSPKQV